MKSEKFKLMRRFRGLLALVVGVALVTIGLTYPAPAQKSEEKSEMAAADFPRLVTDYLSDLHSRHPTQAATSGIHSWDSQLEDYSQSSLAAEACAIKKFHARL